jgi:hypothetical protein
MLNKMTKMALAGALVLGTLGAASVAQARVHHNYTNGWNAYGYSNEGNASAPDGGAFINGNFIPRGTSPAQVPSHHEEDNYGSGVDK